MRDGAVERPGPLVARLVERTGQTQGFCSARARVLIVHTNSDFRGYLAEVLEGGGYQVAQADDLNLACRLLRYARYDVVVTDLLDSGPPTYRSVLRLVETAAPTPVALCLRQRERLRVHPARLGLAACWSTESGARSLLQAVSFLARPTTAESTGSEQSPERAARETQSLREIDDLGIRP